MALGAEQGTLRRLGSGLEHADDEIVVRISHMLMMPHPLLSSPGLCPGVPILQAGPGGGDTMSDPRRSCRFFDYPPMEVEEEEKEHSAPADSIVVALQLLICPSAEEIKPFETE
ncbi:hypothetical protein Tco_1457700 [Tanacetum coccineum]